MIEEYFESVRAVLQTLSLAQSPQVEYDYRDRETGFLKGIWFLRMDHACISVNLFRQNLASPLIATCMFINTCAPTAV